MKGKRLASNRSNVDKEGWDAPAATQLSGEVILGDLIWVRLPGSSWWPAQVVDEHTLSGRNKPSNRSAGEVLVRLYGSYKYTYVDPVKCRSEFENILKQHNGSYGEIFKKALEEDLRCLKSGTSKGNGSKSEEKVRVDVSQEKRSKKNLIKKSQEMESPTSTSGALGKHPAARIRVTRMLKTDLDAKTSADNASENQGTKRHTVKKNLVDNGTSARVSQMISDANTPQAKVKNGNSLLGKTEEARGRKRNHDEVQRKLDPNSPKSARLSSRRQPAAGVLQTIVKNGNLLPEETTEAKSKKPKQDSVHEELEPNIPRSVRKSPRRVLSDSSAEAINKKRKEGGVQKKLKPNHPSSQARISPESMTAVTKPQTMVKKDNLLSKKTKEKARSKDTNQDGVQRKLTPNYPSTNGPESTITSHGKSQELSARRMKVMQSLGLIAPSGSPFH